MLKFRLATAEDCAAIAQLEQSSYPSDESASLEAIQFRQKEAGSFFHIASTLEDELVGFINSTLTFDDQLTHDTMRKHESAGQYLCVHSVVVAAKFRRRGFASHMLNHYTTTILQQHEHILSMLLICKAYLLGFYSNCGFQLVRQSPVVHGKDPWFEMRIDCTERRKLTIFTIDAFTTESFKGNPAAVVPMTPKQFHAEHADKLMQSIGSEMNLSETAFVAPTVDGKLNSFDLRWFTPVCEVDLCGHATLAATIALVQEGYVKVNDSIEFHTKGGVLNSQVNESGLVKLRFPIEQCSALSNEDKEEVLPHVMQGLGVNRDDIIDIQKNRIDLLVHLSSKSFSNLSLSTESIKKIDTRLVVATCQPLDAESTYDFQSRCFGPRCGVDEDPVTGSAHCGLAPYWANLLKKNKLSARQASERGGDLLVTLEDDGVVLEGFAKIVLRGKLQC